MRWSNLGELSGLTPVSSSEKVEHHTDLLLGLSSILLSTLDNITDWRWSSFTSSKWNLSYCYIIYNIPRLKLLIDIALVYCCVSNLWLVTYLSRLWLNFRRWISQKCQGFTIFLDIRVKHQYKSVILSLITLYFKNWWWKFFVKYYVVERREQYCRGIHS